MTPLSAPFHREAVAAANAALLIVRGFKMWKRPSHVFSIISSGSAMESYVF